MAVRRNGRLALPKILIKSYLIMSSSSTIAARVSSASASTSISFGPSNFSSSMSMALGGTWLFGATLGSASSSTGSYSS